MGKNDCANLTYFIADIASNHDGDIREKLIYDCARLVCCQIQNFKANKIDDVV